MQEWVRDIGSQAGLTPANTRINSGAVGVPESRLEVRAGRAGGQRDAKRPRRALTLPGL